MFVPFVSLDVPLQHGQEFPPSLVRKTGLINDRIAGLENKKYLLLLFKGWYEQAGSLYVRSGLIAAKLEQNRNVVRVKGCFQAWRLEKGFAKQGDSSLDKFVDTHFSLPADQHMPRTTGDGAHVIDEFITPEPMQTTTEVESPGQRSWGRFANQTLECSTPRRHPFDSLMSGTPAKDLPTFLVYILPYDPPTT